MPNLYDVNDLLDRHSDGKTNWTLEKENFVTKHNLDNKQVLYLFGGVSYNLQEFRLALEKLKASKLDAYQELINVHTAYIPGTKTTISLDLTTKVDPLAQVRDKALANLEERYWGSSFLGASFVTFLTYVSNMNDSRLDMEYGEHSVKQYGVFGMTRKRSVYVALAAIGALTCCVSELVRFLIQYLEEPKLIDLTAAGRLMKKE